MKVNILRTLPFVSYIAILILPLIFLSVSNNLFQFLFAVYIFYGIFKSFNLLYGVIGGYYRYKKESNVNWLDEIDEELPYQLIAIPINNEDISIVKRNISSILKQEYAINKLFVTVSKESSKDFLLFKNELERHYTDVLGDRLLIVEHVLSKAEVAGAAANRTHAVKESVAFLKSFHKDINDFLVTSPDADTVFDKSYFARVAYQWLADSKKDNVFYQTGVYKFDNNINRVPVAVRIVSIGISIGTLSSAYTENQNRYTFSCFTIPLKTLVAINYWDTSISIDDTPLYWRAYKYFEGHFECKSFYIPISVDSIESENYFDTHFRQYKQIHRWGWGIIVFPEAIKSILSSKLTTGTKILQLLYFTDVTILLKALPPSIIIFLFLTETTGLLSTLSYISFILLVIGSPWVFKLTIEDSRMSLLTILITVFWFLPLGLVNVFVFCLFPFFQAAAEFALGMSIDNKINWAIKIPDKNKV